MSSECRCHLNEWCFYCEMYVPLLREKEALEVELATAVRIIHSDAELRKQMTEHLRQDIERMGIWKKHLLKGEEA